MSTFENRIMIQKKKVKNTSIFFFQLQFHLKITVPKCFLISRSPFSYVAGDDSYDERIPQNLQNRVPRIPTFKLQAVQRR